MELSLYSASSKTTLSLDGIIPFHQLNDRTTYALQVEGTTTTQESGTLQTELRSARPGFKGQEFHGVEALSATQFSLQCFSPS
jgi:hypothetical protein